MQEKNSGVPSTQNVPGVVLGLVINSPHILKRVLK